ncbi:MAG: class B sortase [Aristaeellaceae bacterium]
MRKLLSMLIALMLLAGCAWAEEPQLPQEELLPREELHAAVDQLFTAVAGTTEDEEKTARKGLTKDEIQLRNDEQAAYRAETLPWLLGAFIPAEETGEELPLQPESTAVPEEWLQAEEERQQALTAAYEALQANDQGAAFLALLEPLGGVDRDSCLAVTQELCRAWMAEIDHAALTEMNVDYACWLYCAGMNIDYPVVHGTDNDRYLSTMFNGEKNASGTLFIDYRNLPGFQDPNTLIYGHHMRNNGMFGQIDEYASQSFYASHPYMLVMSETEICVLELFAGYTTSSKDHCYDIAISDEEDMAVFVQEAKRKSAFSTAVEVLSSDRLITMSTCAYSFENARFIVIGRLLTVWQMPEDAMFPADAVSTPVP